MDRRRRHERRKSAENADIGGIPPIVNPRRRRACGQSLHLFLATYFPETTGATLFSADHVSVIDRIEAALLFGGRFCNSVYRGFAKTTITENSAVWAALYGLRQYVLVIGADKSGARGILQSITHELTENDLLFEDFPEVCLPFRALDGRSQRAASQTHGGELTHLAMTAETLVFPTISLDDGSQTPSSGCIVRARGILAASRGAKFKRPDGVNARPDFALLDDFQTDESAKSPQQVGKRLGIIRRAILKSAGHRKSIAAVGNVTVIERDDAVEQLLDPIRNPAWDGVRIPMVKRWADEHEGLWLEYARIRRSFDRSCPGDQQRAARDATAFYRANRAQLDAGCIVGWNSCYDPETELSAIQHAYNLFFDDPPDVFASECQNEPIKETPGGFQLPDPGTLARKVNGFKRGVIPPDVVQLTAFVDVHEDVLYWAVVGWNADCTGYVVDYGTWPDQNRAYFAKREATRTLRRKFPKIGTEGAIVEGLKACLEQLCGREWKRTDGAPVRVAKALIDSGNWASLVEIACRSSPHAAILQMSRGKGVRASDRLISEYQRKPGWQIGDQWFIPPATKRSLRIVTFDANHWKRWLHDRLAAHLAVPGSLTLFGDDHANHHLIADHVVCEQPDEISAESTGRTVLQFENRSGRDNHWFDCLVGCGVAASLLGLKVAAAANVDQSTKTRRQRAIEAYQKRGRA